MCDETSLKHAPWVLAATQELNRQDSWTGRIHLHKLLFVTQVLRVDATPFDFVLYDYGPYSFGLDEAIVDLELFGLLNRSYPKPGYGPRYEVSATGEPLARQLDSIHRESIARTASALGNRKGGELELIATCFWVTHEEGLEDREAVVNRVSVLKPTYGATEIDGAWATAQDIAKRLCS